MLHGTHGIGMGVIDNEYKALTLSKRMSAVPEFEREVMFYLVFASLFPGTIPHIHGIIQVFTNHFHSLLLLVVICVGIHRHRYLYNVF